MTAPLVSCLVPTYGRFGFLRELVAWFLAQDYPAKELIILNNHPTPIRCDLPGVFVVNMPGHPTMGECWTTLLKLAGGELTTRWADDDRYLPWHLSQAVERWLQADKPAAWQPMRSWLIAASDPANIGYRLSAASPYISAALIRTDAHRAAGEVPSSGDDDVRLIAYLKDKIVKEEVGARSSYCYYWNGRQHASAVLQNKQPVAERVAEWQRRNSDAGDGQTPLAPADIRPKLQELADHCNDDPQLSWTSAPWPIPHPYLSETERAELKRLIEGQLNCDPQITQISADADARPLSSRNLRESAKSADKESL